MTKRSQTPPINTYREMKEINYIY